MQRGSLEFKIQPTSGVPIYRQIMDQIRALLAGGKLLPGQLLPSVRQVAHDLEINMMTVSKAYGKLEAEGLVERVRGRGMRVTEQTPQGNLSKRKNELKSIIDPVITRGLQLGLTPEQILAVVNSVLKERLP